MGLLDWFKTDDENDENDEQKPKPDPRLGSGWTPGGDGAWLLPDSTREPLEDIGVGRRHLVPRSRD